MQCSNHEERFEVTNTTREMKPIQIDFESDKDYIEFMKWVDSGQSKSASMNQLRESLKEIREIRNQDKCFKRRLDYMIPIQHTRKAFYFAVMFLQNEIIEIEQSLERDHLLEESERILKNRLSDLESDLDILESYEIHY